MRTHSDGPQVKTTDRLITRTPPLGQTLTLILGFLMMKKTLSVPTRLLGFTLHRTKGISLNQDRERVSHFLFHTACVLAALREKRPCRVSRLNLYSRFFSQSNTHAHNTHTHTHVGFYGLRGLSIGVMVFILYKLYVLLPYTYPTPKLSPHRRRCISIFPQKNSLCMIYKRFKLWGHWKCPHKSPSPCNTYVIPMSLYKFVSS